MLRPAQLSSLFDPLDIESTSPKLEVDLISGNYGAYYVDIFRDLPHNPTLQLCEVQFRQLRCYMSVFSYLQISIKIALIGK